MSERPRRLTVEMRDRVARKVADALEARGLTDSAVEAASDIAMHGDLHKDGYEIARDLERYCYWDCSLEIAEELNSFGDHAMGEIEAAEKAWFEADNPSPPLPIGARIKLRNGDAGEITGIYEYGTAKYLVKVDDDPHAGGPHNSRRIIPWEEACAE